ncbi:hypothetical protein ElyMa_004307600 [Elysia marginata]|uniref:Uncharacterized protein n=1 Tax=Elysia marginata TaxID=1093978 RepID=A0AAV4GYG1_9GAST|nr:hypothetical protein ElyMa_004307600 [Elysia marginata]
MTFAVIKGKTRSMLLKMHSTKEGKRGELYAFPGAGGFVRDESFLIINNYIDTSGDGSEHTLDCATDSLFNDMYGATMNPTIAHDESEPIHHPVTRRKVTPL